MSAAGAAAAAAAWLPGPDGAFHRPAELQLDDLPPEYLRDDALAAALGMIQPVVAEASRQLGLPPGLLRGLSAHPDLVAMVERGSRPGRPVPARPGGPGRRPRPTSPTTPWPPGCATSSKRPPEPGRSFQPGG